MEMGKDAARLSEKASAKIARRKAESKRDEDARAVTHEKRGSERA